MKKTNINKKKECQITKESKTSFVIRMATVRNLRFLGFFSLRRLQSAKRIFGISPILAAVETRQFYTGTEKFTKLAEVGKLEPIKEDNYDTGQFFIHRIFGYRGVTLFQWTANVFNRDKQMKTGEKFTSTTPARNKNRHDKKETKGETHTYYQVLTF